MGGSRNGMAGMKMKVYRSQNVSLSTPFPSCVGLSKEVILHFSLPPSSSPQVNTSLPVPYDIKDPSCTAPLTGQ